LEADTTPPSVPIAVVMGGCLGFFAGVSGTGGGIFLSPLLLLMRWAPTRSVSGVSATFILLNSISGLFGTPFVLDKLPSALPIWAVAVILGGMIGTHLGTRTLSIQGIRFLLAGVLVIAGGKMLLT